MGVIVLPDVDNDPAFVSVLSPPLGHIADLGVNAKARTVYIGDIDENTAAWFAGVLHYLQGEDEPISVWLNSPGGDVISMFAIHDLIRDATVPIRMVGYGQVCSAAVLLLACAPRRLVTESCMWMSHEPWGFGDPSDMGLRAAKDRRKADDWTQEWWCELMSRYTPDDAAHWKRTTERKAEYWLLGGRAIVEAGLADAVLGVGT